MGAVAREWRGGWIGSEVFAMRPRGLESGV
jgi:hypothetical protein